MSASVATARSRTHVRSASVKPALSAPSALLASRAYSSTIRGSSAARAPSGGTKIGAGRRRNGMHVVTRLRTDDDLHRGIRAPQQHRHQPQIATGRAATPRGAAGAPSAAAPSSRAGARSPAPDTPRRRYSSRHPRPHERCAPSVTGRTQTRVSPFSWLRSPTTKRPVRAGCRVGFGARPGSKTRLSRGLSVGEPPRGRPKKGETRV